LPNLIKSLLDVGEVLSVDFIRTVHPHGYLIGVVCNVADKFVDPVELFLVEIHDVALKDHRSDELAP